MEYHVVLQMDELHPASISHLDSSVSSQWPMTLPTNDRRDIVSIAAVETTLIAEPSTLQLARLGNLPLATPRVSRRVYCIS